MADTSVITRKKPFATMLINHLMSNVFSLLIIVFAFKWLYNMPVGIIVLFTMTTIFYMSGVYSYSYDQPRIDKRNEGEYNYEMPFKIGGLCALIIFLPALIHFVIRVATPAESIIYIFSEPILKLWNYAFFYFFYGADGEYFNILAVIVITLIPIAVSYFSYYLGVRRFSFLEKVNRVIYRKDR